MEADGALSSDSDSDTGVLIRPLVKYEPQPPEGSNMALELRKAFRRHDKKVLLVDIANKIEWTGAELLERASQVAAGLVNRLGVKPNDVIMTICNHTDMEILLALGILFSGAAIYGTQPNDGYAEKKVLCELVRPNVLVVQSDLHEWAIALRNELPGMAQTKIVWLDNPIAGLTPIRSNSINVNGRGRNESASILAMMVKDGRRRQRQRRLSEFDLDENNNHGNYCDTNNNYTMGKSELKLCANDNDNDHGDGDKEEGEEEEEEERDERERMLELKRVIDRDRVTLFDELVNGPTDEHLIESIARDAIKPTEHVVTYMLTSGSTDRPKVVPSTHEELVHGLYSMISASVNPILERASVRRCSQISAQRPMRLATSETSASVASAASCLSGMPSIVQKANGFNSNQQQQQHDSATNGAKNGCITMHNGIRLRFREPLLPFGPREIVSGDLPLDHGAGFNTMLLALWLGAKYIVMPSYDADVFWQAVSDHKISVSISSTTFCYKLFSRLKALIDSGETSKWHLDSFRFIACTGAKMAFHELVHEVTRVYSHMRVVQSYGCTEIGLIALLHGQESETHQHSVGYLLPGLVAKVVDRDKTSDKPLGPEERGELLLCARSKFKGYKCHWRDDPARIFAECHDSKGLFYRTGDQAHYDHDGRLYIHGRFKDTLVLMEDWKILPAELEEVVQEHPLVEMCAIVGVPDLQLPGCHKPRAFVKLIPLTDSAEVKQLAKEDQLLVARCLANDRDFICKHIFDFVAERTARPKHLTGGVRILDDFPRIGLLNKIDRKVLKQMD